MAVYRPKRNGESSKVFVCEFVYLGKRFPGINWSDYQDRSEGIREAKEGRIGASGRGTANRTESRTNSYRQ